MLYSIIPFPADVVPSYSILDPEILIPLIALFSVPVLIAVLIIVLVVKHKKKKKAKQLEESLRNNSPEQDLS